VALEGEVFATRETLLLCRNNLLQTCYIVKPLFRRLAVKH
jgi:hypothetical protein